MSDKIPYGKCRAIQILVADELGIKTEFVPFAKMYLEGTLAPMQFGRMEIAGWKATMEINEKGLEEKALELSKKYL